MFTYLNPDVRRRLIADGKLRASIRGAVYRRRSAGAPQRTRHQPMGPIPLPIKLPGVDTTVRWYAAVRSTELRGVEALAADLNARGGQHLFAHLVSPLAVNACW